MKFEVVNKEIQDIISCCYEKVYSNMINEFESFCQNKGCSLEIREKRRTVLTRRKAQYQQKCNTFFKNSIAVFIDKKSRLVSMAKIHERIREIMQDKSKVINKE